MKAVNKIISACILVSMALFVSCKDDEDSGPKSKTDLLTQFTWLYNSGTSSDPLAGAFLVLLEDSEYTFKKNGTYDGLILGISGSGTWSFADNETKLNIDDDVYTLTTLNETTLEITQTDGGITNSFNYRKK